jgi:hypothetical protein
VCVPVGGSSMLAIASLATLVELAADVAPTT